MNTILYGGLFVVGLLLLATIIGLLRIVLAVPKHRWAEANELSGSTANVLYGEVEADRDGIRDPRVAKGKVWDKATKQWLPQGKLSDEYLNSLAS